MNKKYMLYIFTGMVVGAVFGTAFGLAIENNGLATALSAVGRLFTGRFFAAAVLEKNDGNN